MSNTKILLDPVDFDALHFSALAFGGIGHSEWERDGAPHCKAGHAHGLAKGMNQRLADAGLSFNRNDSVLRAAGVQYGEKVDFESYIELLNIDIEETA